MRPMLRRAGLLLLGLGLLAGAFYAGVQTHRYRAQIKALLRPGGTGQVLQTSLYNVVVRTLAIPGEGRDGGIAPLDEGVLLVNREGRFWYAERDGLRELAIRVPINLDEFRGDPYNETTIHRELFGVKDLLIEPTAAGLRIHASHNQWVVDGDCYGLRISTLDIGREELLGGGTGGSWRTTYETQPCMPLTDSPDGRSRNPTLASGGRMVLLPSGELLVTVGGFGPETDLTGAPPGSPFGKTILIDQASGETRPWTSGHRNPEGLALGPDGRVWLTEHGDRGGDELNLLREGGDYGYPRVSYGTAYGMMIWPGNPRQGRHDGYEKPMFVWTPGIGISQLIVVEGAAFAHWEGDLIVSSLTGQSLFRVRVEDGRTIFTERLDLEHRIRDVTQVADGSIVIKTDDDLLMWLSPAEAGGEAAASLSASERGAIVAAQCQGCHSLDRDGANAIGPALWGVAGRDIASREGYSYSPALDTLDGRWTADALRAYLAAPDSFAPGTSMQLPRPLTSTEVDDLVEYLEGLR